MTNYSTLDVVQVQAAPAIEPAVAPEFPQNGTALPVGASPAVVNPETALIACETIFHDLVCPVAHFLPPAHFHGEDSRLAHIELTSSTSPDAALATLREQANNPDTAVAATAAIQIIEAAQCDAASILPPGITRENVRSFALGLMMEIRKQQPARAPALGADDLPAPTLTNEKGKLEYDPAQLVALLHPDWPVENLATHAALAQRIRDELGADLRSNPNLGWLDYDERCWLRDDKHATRTAARVATLSQVVRDEAAALYHFAATLAQAGRESDAKAMSAAAVALLRHTKQVETKSFIEGAVHLAAGLLTVETEQFDQKPWVIGFQNGTWAHGQWREHRRDDYLLHLSPVELDFDADRTEWLAVLDRITGNDSDFALMLQDVCGYIFSAASHLRLLPFFYGPKGTGKSTVAELLQTVLGGMAATIDPKKLEATSDRERLGANLWNRRLAVCSEAGSKRLEAELLKTLSGGDRLDVRFLFREPFTAPPRHVLLMVTNDPPHMDAHDEALKDRVITLPFVHPLDNGAPLELTGGRRIEAVRQDPTSALVRGFAAWALEGLQRVFETQDIHRAACAQTATAQFWADTDPITPFWETVTEVELLVGISKTDLRKRYEQWAASEGARPLGRHNWARACESHGLADEKRTGGTRFWYLQQHPNAKKEAQVAQLSHFPKGTREDNKSSRVQFQNRVTCATSATNGALGALGALENESPPANGYGHD